MSQPHPTPRLVQITVSPDQFSKLIFEYDRFESTDGDDRRRFFLDATYFKGESQEELADILKVSVETIDESYLLITK